MSAYPVTEVLMQGGFVLTLYGVSKDEVLRIGTGSLPNRLAARHPDMRPVSLLHVHEKSEREFAPL